jgi:phosphate transport system substrate-binding protein
LVRYLKQISGNKDFKQKNIYALKSNKEVIKYVSEHPDAIGITGFAWLNDPDKDYADAVDKVKIVGIKDESSKTAPSEYFKPSQTTLVQHTYPLSRSLYIIDCTGRKGLGAGFASFLASERGQRIILKSGLLPDSIPTREINITH